MSRSIDIHIGKRLKLLRQRRKLSRLDLEIATNIVRGSIKKFEDGTQTIKSNELFQIANLLMTTIGFFYKDPDINHKHITIKKAVKVNDDTVRNGTA